MKWSDLDAYKYFNKDIQRFIYRIYLYLFEALCLKGAGEHLIVQLI